ncbi:MAG: sodium:solute symporter family protein [Phycisphaerae bacterium]
MQLNSLDWTVVIVCTLITFLPVLFYIRRSGKGTTEFFASGQSAPWWLIGTSMVATTFSTDTPNLVTDFVRTGGVAKNWLWWAFLVTGMTTVFFYARLWRRSGVLTDLEFYELRYSGKSAAFLRGFRAIYLGLFFNCIIMASVTLAAAKIGSVMLGWPREQTVIVCALICIVFGSISGLWGVLATDLVQFVLAMVGVFAAAFVALQQPEVGGLSGMLAKVGAAHPDKLSMLPPLHVADASGATVTNWDALLPLFLIPLLVQWWSVWYPGAEPGGGSYIAQRMLAARSERDALLGTLWFNLAHYALRPWPWIIVALCSLLVFPTLDDIRRALPHVDPSLIGHDLAYPAMLTRLPHGLLGLLVASLLAAYVSTMTTHMNWGTSYLVLDFYRRFVDPRASEGALVWMGRVVSALLMIFSGALMFALTTAGDAFGLMLSIGAGTGSVYLLRWFWWRVNAWSEIAGMAVSFLVSIAIFVLNRLLATAVGEPGLLVDWLRDAGMFKPNAAGALQVVDHVGLIVTVVTTTIAWVVVTLLTPPTDRATLLRFYERIRPAGPGWSTIRASAAAGESGDSLGEALLGSLLGCVFIYSALFAAGNALYGQWVAAAICIAFVAVSGAVLFPLLRRMLSRA